MTNSEITASKNNIVVETDVVIFPMDEILGSDDKISITETSKETFTPANESSNVETPNRNIHSK